MKGIKRLHAIQLLLLILIALSTLVTIGKQEALSALLGGLIAFIPSVLFVKKFFQHQGARAAKQIVKSFYVGEFLKIVLSMLLFMLVFIIYKVSPLAFFLTYVAVIVTHWFAPLIIDNKYTSNRFGK